MRSRLSQTLLPLLVLLVLLAGLGYMAGLFDRKLPPALSASGVTPEAGYRVALEQVERSEPVPATVRARQSTQISSRLLARIERLEVRAGDTVEPNQVLVTLEQADLAARVQQASARIDLLEARQKEVGSSLSRMETLFTQGAVSQAELDRARASFSELQAELRAAAQALSEARTALSYTVIRSPIAGRVVDRYAEPGDTAQPGIPLLDLYNPVAMQVEASVRESLALSLQPGDSLEVEVPALGAELSGRIEEIVPAANASTRSFLVKVQVSGQPLLPGMYARIRVPTEAVERVVIPRQYLTEVGQLNLVWVPRAGGVEKRVVRLGRVLADGRLEVIAGLSEGESLILPAQAARLLQ
ncbi:efflux RND transporter periplasmic adaptor subunit [Aestuariirhabdus litorea]|uniref:Efflux RND transporter periplasmic adaptor subunit n=1 Tax=Aestuariirhabdus litorea TaxID=2528527 RepID=A0A3P3VPR3_9GAMM|nr:efflux RND transporter periplasmic adaptor subunit [Aestuariirhabdus litorea]RRJ84715.1 efflux RND transporter periplasmic adaptor subunit [Aestuariirhabdus litorea]RWW97940.1 efflux RND transporter periplasmic adaptor subunit [Endozoicomonadaceae bacterium GTF-13]